METTIGLAKVKLFILLLACIAATIGSYFMLVEKSAAIRSDPTFHSPTPFHSPIFVHSLGFACLIFSILGAVGTLKMLLDEKPGLTIDERGIVDNSSVFPAGRIPWSNISGFEPRAIGGKRVLYVVLKDRSKYITTRSKFLQYILKYTVFWVPSPVCIKPTFLHVRFDELVKILSGRLAEQRRCA